MKGRDSEGAGEEEREVERGREREKERGREREIFPPLVHFPNAHHSWCLARLKPGAINSIWVFHVSHRDPRT